MRVAFTASGDVTDFTTERRAALLDALARAAGLSTTPPGANLTITPASVRIEATLPVANSSAASTAATNLESALSSPAAATSMLAGEGLDWMTVETPAVVESPSSALSPPPSMGTLNNTGSNNLINSIRELTDDNLVVFFGAVGGGGLLLLVCCIVVCVTCVRRANGQECSIGCCCIELGKCCRCMARSEEKAAEIARQRTRARTASSAGPHYPAMNGGGGGGEWGGAMGGGMPPPVSSPAMRGRGVSFHQSGGEALGGGAGGAGGDECGWPSASHAVPSTPCSVHTPMCPTAKEQKRTKGQLRKLEAAHHKAQKGGGTPLSPTGVAMTVPAAMTPQGSVPNLPGTCFSTPLGGGSMASPAAGGSGAPPPKLSSGNSRRESRAAGGTPQKRESKADFRCTAI